ncbi:MAG: hypothetical protein A3I07_01135 [Candidatus Doudnabacteria bacterium RIFCSPLOWO2_02_FULL_42_9]|uniref:Uncharacterized protein n=1 Tax=Candidatus Doudnabacteria bacterium RIFCSPHIGHO2_01_FULL_41_86 TaxID=1817821 RepID=A0A1F5N8V8_9BACT|nr:MAG: hypothetical protein A2717_00680 [Candidatus Doudnabacteria bacterium RIFCSPHIGHO2_01_FULL_41_86]OGE75358.1 MAG: hypothetical protein A3K07_01190 [Candidatus Doudnabacteria bacterium RIFCSPHIGHO2_01_43_10]OGE86535.1 MAG: hypothetical protein A3E28_04740 [Candidatus Doudnabacteria bacterium RIFCSPHIGHO2_12_FULL_42_22]OGE87458.1 MAG: hypothetical protein A3C49_01325 [Candidatus Doudnabacteria bacterium RIFCSPHIGHO2_02_FULL_42_25]OGE92752.1 MAG: hypothetical protein A2895_04485 [Candidatus
MNKLVIFSLFLFSFTFSTQTKAVIQNLNGLTPQSQTFSSDSVINIISTGSNHSFTTVSDSIGNSQLLYDTGQHLATTSDVIFSTLTLNNTGLHLLDTNVSHDLIVSSGSDLTADRILTILTGDANRALTLVNDAIISGTNTGDVSLAGSYDYLSLTNQQITLSPIDLITDITGILSTVQGGTGVNSLNDLIILGTHSTGNYISTIVGSSPISVFGSGSESADVTLGLIDDSINSAKFDLVNGNTSVDEQCLTYENGGVNGSLEWQPCSSGISIGIPITGSSAGSILFVESPGILAENNSNFSWDNSGNLLKLGGDVNFNDTSGSSTRSISIANAIGTNQSGDSLWLSSGKGSGTADSGNVRISAAHNFTGGNGGAIEILGGGTDLAGDAGDIRIQAGSTSGFNSSGDGGNISLAAGYAFQNTGVDGYVNINTGFGAYVFDDRTLFMDQYTGNLDPYKILVSNRFSSPTNPGVDLQIAAGNGGTISGDPGDVTISAGTVTSGNGGDVGLYASSGLGFNRNGGNIILQAGEQTGEGNTGAFKFLIGDDYSGTLDFKFVTGQVFTFQNVSGTIPLLQANQTFTGSNTFRNSVNKFVSNSNQSTVYIGSMDFGGTTGCIVMGDSDGNGVTYITANNGVVTASITQPSNCQ